MTENRICWVHAITPLHVGAGKGVGFIDLPIMREKVTGWPLLPGSTIKGVLRDYFEQNGSEDARKLIETAFGPRVSDVLTNAGSLVLTDAHLVALPVRSLYGTFAYVTCPMSLNRLKRDLKLCELGDMPEIPNTGRTEALHSGKTKLREGNKIFFEDLDLSAAPNDLVDKWAQLISDWVFPKDVVWRDIFKERFVILSDDCFGFLTEIGTEVAARVKIEDDKKTAKDGALWYEEALPSEAILAGLVWCDRIYTKEKFEGLTPKKLVDLFCLNEGLDLQIGGKATVGKGRVNCVFAPSAKKGE